MEKPANELEAIAAVEGFTAARLARNVSRLRKFISDDFIFWSNASNLELSGEAALSHFHDLFKKMREDRHDDIRQIITPTGVIRQYTSNFDTENGVFEGVPMLSIFATMRDKVIRCDEYLDTTGLPAFVRA